MKKELIDGFRRCFDGYTRAYGILGELEEDDSGKMQGRNTVVKNAVTDELFERHLDGTGNGLRLIPLKDNNKLRYAAIDLDKKQKTTPLKDTIEQIEDKIDKLKLPLIPCQSKSGDIHLYCFTKEDVEPKLLMARMNEWASLLGYGSAEKFPKQTSRLSEEDTGSALNLPYFDYKNTTRFAINKKKRLSLAEFIEFVDVMRVSKEELKSFKLETSDDSYNDAPPCLQILSTLGVEEGSRNAGLYDFAVYYKQKYPDDFEDRIVEANINFFKPRLSRAEVENIIKSVHKKTFFYKCNEDPIASHCNKIECPKRKFGIGNQTSSGELHFDSITKHTSGNSVRWYVEMQGKRIQLETEDLLNQKLLQKKILDATTKLFQPMKPNKWIVFMDGLLNNCDVVEDPEDASEQGQFKNHFFSFLTGSTHSTKKSDLAVFDTYLEKNPNDASQNIIYFKAASLYSYLKPKGLHYKPQDICHWVRALKGEVKTVRIANNKTIQAWHVPAPDLYSDLDMLKDTL